MQSYDATFGKPLHAVQENMQLACKQIQQTTNWGQYFEWLGIETPTPMELCRWLESAVRNSEIKGYHSK